MKIEYLRASTANSYSDCQFRYYLTYLIGLPDPTQRKALLGTICHAVWELLGRAKRTGHYPKYKDKYTDTEYLLKICWARHQKDNPHILLDKKDYKFCQKQIAAICESRFNPLNLKVIDTEKQFNITIKKPGFSYKDSLGETRYMNLRGTIDLITESPYSPSTIEIIDFKSGQRLNWLDGSPKELESFFKDLQLKCYEIATRQIYPTYRYRIFTVIFSRDGGPFSVSFSEEDMRSGLSEFRRIFNEIKNNNNPSRLKDDPSRRYKEGFKCKFVCGYGQKSADNNGNTLCDKYYKILRNNSLEEASKKLIQIKLGEDLKKKISPRNDYSDPRGKIFKGTIE